MRRIILMIALAACARAAEYHPLAIADIVREDPAHWRKMRTHVEVEGFVLYHVKEADGDRHIGLCDSRAVRDFDRRHCVVVECIPVLPCSVRAGEHVRARGISRFDGEHPGHHWWEVHPCLEMEVLK